MEPAEKPIIVFDGVCNLCNGTVVFVITRDPQKHFRFVPFQSGLAAALAKKHHFSMSLETIVLVEGNQCFERSDAILRILRKLPGFWPWLAVLLVIPRPLRDAAYNLVSRNRYRWFGKGQQCLIPSKDVMTRFL